MLQTKRPLPQFINRPTRQSENPQSVKSFHIRRCESRNIQQGPGTSLSVDLDVQREQVFVCFQCANTETKRGCSQCQGTGLLKATHPLVQLMNDIFNAKFVLSSAAQPHKKDMVSTKTSSNSNISDSFASSEKLSNSVHRNCSKSRQSKQKQTQKSSILDSLLTPLQTIIKQQSTIDQKSKKCNICHYQFQSVKYMCPQCQSYNVCEQCYQTKHFNHCHQLKKIQSVTSQKTYNVEEGELEVSKEQKQLNPMVQQWQLTHSDVDRLSLLSDSSGVEMMFNCNGTQKNGNYQLKEQNQQNSHQQQEVQYSNNNHNDGLGFFKLHQIQSSQPNYNDNNNFTTNLQHQQQCNTCNQHIQDCCYWICETCKQSGVTYKLCKDCYDHQMFKHPKEHKLGLNFFTLDEDFFAAQTGENLFDRVKEGVCGTEGQLQDFKTLQDEKENIKPIPSLLRSNSKLASSTTPVPEMLNIGIIKYKDIKYKDIFTGFHKQTENEHYNNEIISPIPRSLKLTHSFKDKKQPTNMNNSDAEIMAQLLYSSVNSTPKKELKTAALHPQQQTPKKENFYDQSRVYFDENAMMNLQLSQDYNSLTPNEPHTPTTKQLYKSQNKYIKQQSTLTPHQPPHPKKIINLFPNITLQQINPQTSILEFNTNQQQDYYFTEYFCNICNVKPIKSIKYHCLECEDYDLCEECYLNNRVEHWHDHFRKDDGRLKCKKILQNKKRIITKAVNNLNRSLSPTRRSFMYLK